MRSFLSRIGFVQHARFFLRFVFARRFFIELYITLTPSGLFFYLKKDVGALPKGLNPFVANVQQYKKAKL